jgi:hypothetical protein
LNRLLQAHGKAASELLSLCAICCVFEEQVPLPIHFDHYAIKETVRSESFFESSNVVVLPSPPSSIASSVDMTSQSYSATELSLLDSVRNHGMQIVGISQRNKELLHAASAIHMRYETKVTSALKEFRREITELERQFSMRRIDEATFSSSVPALSSPAPISTPAAGTLKSKQNRLKKRPL